MRNYLLLTWTIPIYQILYILWSVIFVDRFLTRVSADKGSNITLERLPLKTQKPQLYRIQTWPARQPDRILPVLGHDK